jgi:ATP-dependent exoDNAse (exonuclease V) beta subunit
VEAFDLTPPTWSTAPIDDWPSPEPISVDTNRQPSFDFVDEPMRGQHFDDQEWLFDIAPQALSDAPAIIAWQEAEAWLEREQALWAEEVVELTPPVVAVYDDVEDRARFEFPKGTTSGNCLHKILEYLDPNKPAVWHQTFAKQMKEHNIHNIDPHSLVPWFTHILHAPLPDGAHLAGLGFRERVREMEFYLSLPQGEIPQERLRQVLKEQQIEIPHLRQTQSVRYLKGTMDLVYQHQGQFYVADYKSNWLSTDKTQGQLADYHVDRLPQAMHAHHYGLQAALYLVALHRYLKTRLARYEPQQHLGGAVYLFLRGMHQQHVDHGVFHWQPPVEWLERLDAALNGEAR